MFHVCAVLAGCRCITPCALPHPPAPTPCAQVVGLVPRVVQDLGGLGNGHLQRVSSRSTAPSAAAMVVGAAGLGWSRGHLRAGTGQDGVGRVAAGNEWGERCTHTANRQHWSQLCPLKRVRTAYLVKGVPCALHAYGGSAWGGKSMGRGRFGLGGAIDCIDCIMIN